MKHLCLSPSVKLTKRNVFWRKFILFHTYLSNWCKNEFTFQIRRKIIRILGEKICQIDVGETRFVFPVQEKRHSKFGFEAKLFVFWVKKFVKLTYKWNTVCSGKKNDIPNWLALARISARFGAWEIAYQQSSTGKSYFWLEFWHLLRNVRIMAQRCGWL